MSDAAYIAFEAMSPAVGVGAAAFASTMAALVSAIASAMLSAATVLFSAGAALFVQAASDSEAAVMMERATIFFIVRFSITFSKAEHSLAG
jgi:predicted membrane protein